MNLLGLLLATSVALSTCAPTKYYDADDTGADDTGADDSGGDDADRGPAGGSDDPVDPLPMACANADSVDGNPCNGQDAEAACVDVSGEQYECLCSGGFQSDGGDCVDLDACVAGDPLDGNPCNTSDLSATCTDELAPSTRYTCSCGPGFDFDAGECVETDGCLARNNPCDDAGDAMATCETLAGGVACTCSEGVQGDLCESFGLVGAGIEGDPFVWADGLPAASCEEYIRPLLLRYEVADVLVDGIYSVAPAGDGEPFEAFCDMTTDGGGWQRVINWDRELAPQTDSLESILALAIDEIGTDPAADPSPMGLVRNEPDHVLWADADTSSDFFSYRFALPSPATAIRASIHMRGASLDSSGVFLFAHSDASVADSDLFCFDRAIATGDYSPAELALLPYDCPAENRDFVNNGVVRANLAGTPADSLVLRGFMQDNLSPDGSLGDVLRLYRLVVFTQSTRMEREPVEILGSQRLR